MATIFLSLGSNVGDSKKYLEKAIELLGERVTVIDTAKFYVTKPMGYAMQADFLNSAIRGETKLSPQELLAFVKNVETRVGRIHRFRWGPREIDIDIIFYGTELINSADLSIPHPRYQERDFVLRPLLDLEPSLTDPVSARPLQQLLNSLQPEQLSISKILKDSSGE